MNYEHLGEMITDKIATYSDRTALRYRDNNHWEPLTYSEFGEKIKELATAMLAAGVAQGENVGIYSANRYEWAVADFACILAGAVSVPIYATNTREQAEFIIKDAGIKLMFIGDRFQYDNISAICSDGLPLTIVSFDPSIEPGSGHYLFQDFLNLPALPETARILEERSSAIKKDNTTTIIYTSGTTGNPKGVMLSHGNLFHQMECVDANFTVTGDDLSLCFLPLSHVYERMWSYYVYYAGAIHTYLEDPKQVIETLQEVKPTAMVSVPRLYEKIYAAVMNKQENASGLKKALFTKAIETGDIYYNKLKHNEPVSLILKLKHAFFDKMVLSKIRGVVGGDKNFFSAGGAPLEQSIEEFFFSCGLLVCQGYGLTETSPMISYNTPQAFRFGTVGKPVPGCEVRIAETGEIQVKGPQVMKGYYNNPEKTAEDIVDGWFKTGDIGEFDEDGFLKITDRIKDLIITSGGKNIAPQKIESYVGKDFYIEQVVTIGEKRNFISALIVPAFEALEAWAEENSISYKDMDELVAHPKVVDFYKERIDMHSDNLAQYETIKKFVILKEPFSIEGGEITPTLKLKRKAINDKYKHLVESMY